MTENKPRAGSYEYNKKYAKKYLQKLAYYQIRMPHEMKSAIEADAAARGESLNQYIINAIAARLGGEK